MWSRARLAVSAKLLRGFVLSNARLSPLTMSAGEVQADGMSPCPAPPCRSAEPHVLEAKDVHAALSAEAVWQALSMEGRLALSSTCSALRMQLCLRTTRVSAQLSDEGDSEDQRRLAALVGRLPHLRHLRAAAPSRQELLALLRRCAHSRPPRVLCASFLWMREPGNGAQAGAWEVLATLEQVRTYKPFSGCRLPLALTCLPSC